MDPKWIQNVISSKKSPLVLWYSPKSELIFSGLDLEEIYPVYRIMQNATFVFLVMGNKLWVQKPFMTIMIDQWHMKKVCITNEFRFYILYDGQPGINRK